MSTIASRSPLNISETMRFGSKGPPIRNGPMAYGDSNGHMTDDVTWLRKVKIVTPIRLQLTISKNGWREGLHSPILPQFSQISTTFNAFPMALRPNASQQKE